MKAACLFFLFICLYSKTEGGVFSEKYTTGLTFKSFEVQKEARTSLCLLPGNDALDLKGGGSIHFDMRLYGDAFGSILRVISNDSVCLSLVAMTKNRKINLILTKASENIVSEIDVGDPLLNGQWVRVSIVLDKKSVHCLVGDRQASINESIEDFVIEKIFFGAHQYKLAYSPDVPQMTIKEVMIKDRSDAVVRYWPCSRHRRRMVYDEIDSHPASASNAVWEIDAHAVWKQEMELSFSQTQSQVAVDTVSGRVFVATLDSLFILHIDHAFSEQRKVAKGNPFMGAPNYLIYDYRAQQLCSYNPQQAELIYYDFHANRWSDSATNHYLGIHQHNSLIDEANHNLVLFGGYGNYQYNANLTTYRLDAHTWESVDLSDQIPPRYLASSFFDGKEGLFVFGGQGNPTGWQAQGIHNFYDLYRIDINEKTCRLLGEIKEPDDRYVFGASMVMDGNKLYVLGNRNDRNKSAIRLFEIDTKTFDYRIVEDSIPYNFHDIVSYATLFRYGNSRLYAVTCQDDNRGKSRVSIHSLSYPVLTMNDVLQPLPSSVGVKAYGILLSGIACCVLLGVVFFWVIRKIKKKSKAEKPPGVLLPATNSETTAFHQECSIRLLGRFKVTSKSGKDITKSFTPIVRQLFILCILEYYPEEKGLTSNYMEDIIWHGMDKSSSTNNRNVTIRKLRLLLQELDNVGLRKEENVWKIEIANDNYCDYKDVMKWLRKSSQTKLVDKPGLERIIKIALSGKLLTDFAAEWADEYKSEYSRLLTDTLLRASRQEEFRSDWELLLSLSDAMLIQDHLDDNAISLKCRSLYQLGQIHLSKQRFEKYYADYLALLNEPPRLSYDTIVSKK